MNCSKFKGNWPILAYCNTMCRTLHCMLSYKVVALIGLQSLWLEQNDSVFLLNQKAEKLGKSNVFQILCILQMSASCFIFVQKSPFLQIYLVAIVCNCTFQNCFVWDYLKPPHIHLPSLFERIYQCLAIIHGSWLLLSSLNKKNLFHPTHFQLGTVLK